MMDKKHAATVATSLHCNDDLDSKHASTRTLLHRLRLPTLLILLTSLFLLSLVALLYLTLPSTTISISLKSLTPTNLFCPPLHAISFNEYPIYKSLSPTSDAAWEALIPENGGFIQKTALQEDGEDREDGKLGISMFHQLHCLVMLRGWIKELKAAANNTFAAESEESGMKMSMGMDMDTHGAEDVPDAPDFREVHLMHCLDYLRQGITCAADSTLEPTTELMLGATTLVNGDGVAHACGDSEGLWERIRRGK